MFIVLVFIITKKWKHPKRPSTDQRICKTCYIHIMEHCVCVCVCVCVCESLSQVYLCQVPLSMEFQAKILEWLIIPFSRGSFWPKDRTRVSHITGRFFTVWAIKEAHNGISFSNKNKLSINTCYNMNKSRKHAKWKKPVTESHLRFHLHKMLRIGKSVETEED